MANAFRRLLVGSCVAALTLSSALTAYGAVGGGGGSLNLTIPSTGQLSAGGNAVAMTFNFTCQPAPDGVTNFGAGSGTFFGGFSGQLIQIQGKKLAYGQGGTNVPFLAVCDGATTNSVGATFFPAVFASPPSPPFKPGKATVPFASGMVCELDSTNNIALDANGNFLFCDGGGINAPVLVMLKS
jgi:hypothetical protein